MPAVLAVDIGGTKMIAARVDETGAILARRRLPTPATDDPEHLFSALAGAIEEVRDVDHDEVACGVGCGGPMRRDGVGVSPLNIPAWRDFPLRSRLSELTGLPTTIDNDAKALALGEGWLGAAVGQRNYLAMVVSTGVGAGIVCDGRLLDGAEANAGHLGHLIVVPGGRACGCGNAGCLEAEVSGTAIAARTGAQPAVADLSMRHHAGTLVGRAVAQVVVLLDLRLALIGGSVALGFGAPFLAAARAELARLATIEYASGARIELVGLGADAPILGAAAVAWRARSEAGR